MVVSSDVHVHPGGRPIIYDILSRRSGTGNLRIERRQVESDTVNAAARNLIAGKGYSRGRVFDHNLHAGLRVDNSVKVSRQLLRGWNGQRKRICYSLAPAFIVEEELCPVFLNRSAEAGPEQVVAKSRILLYEIRYGLQSIVPQVFIRRTMKGIRSRAGGHLNHSAAEASQ